MIQIGSIKQFMFVYFFELEFRSKVHGMRKHELFVSSQGRCSELSHDLNSFLTRVRKLFKFGNYSREKTICGNTAFITYFSNSCDQRNWT